MLNNYFIGIDESDNIISDHINNNSITGYGKLYRDGSSYNGMIKESKMDGNGLIIYSKNSQVLSYSGEFKDNLYNGSGTIKYPNGDTFIGQFKDGKKNGPGKLYNSNGIVIMETEWKDDIIWGKTEYIEYYPNSKNIKISGLMVNSVKVGPWIYCLENGIIERIEYYSTSKDEEQKVEKLERQLIMDKLGYLTKQIIQLDENKNNKKYDFETLLMLGKYIYCNKSFNINNKIDYNKYYDIAIPVSCIKPDLLIGYTCEGSNGKIVAICQTDDKGNMKMRLTNTLIRDPNIVNDMKIYIKDDNTVKVYYLNGSDKLKIYFEGTINMASDRLLNGSLYSNAYCYTGEFNTSNQIVSGTMHHVKVINDKNIVGKIHYKGTFKYGKPDVEGIYYDDNENRHYQGEHNSGRYNGHGTLYRENGTIVWEGEWRNGRKHGRGRLYGDDGLLIAECIYDNDNYDRAI